VVLPRPIATECATGLDVTAFLVERIPEVGQRGRAARRVLHHPPVAQPLQHLGVGSCALGRPAPDLV
jgi:hypothetical protein